MKRDHPLYLPFLDAQQSKNTAFLHQFQDPSFLQLLDEEEKMKLAALFLQKAEEALHEKQIDSFHEASKIAEELSGEKSEVLLNISTLLYHFGILDDHRESILQALGRLMALEEKSPDYFQKEYKAAQLWGNLLVALHRSNPDDSFLEQAIQKYEQALAVALRTQVNPAEIYWDLGEALLFLGQRSKEHFDLKRASDAFAAAEKLGLNQLHFLLDYGTLLLQWGSLLGSPDHLRQGNHYFRQVISKATDQEDMALKRAWFLYANSAKKLVELSHKTGELEFADRIFQEALTSIPEEAGLWLLWGELFLQFGWYNKDISYIDKGLEKLTGLKTGECDPLTLSSLLAQGLIFLGLILEDIRLIKEGQKRVETLLQLGEGRFDVVFASGVAAYASGCYFGEEKSVAEAVQYFEKATVVDPASLFAKHMLFEASFALGEMKGDKYYVKKASTAASRCTQLAPHVPLFWNNHGIALLKMHLFEKRPTLYLEQAIEKFKTAYNLNTANPDLRGLFHYGVAHDLLGQTMEDEKSYEKAVELLAFVLEKIPESLTVKHQLALAYFHKGELTGELEDHWRAIDLFEQVVQHDQEDDGAYLGLGATYLNLSEQIKDPVHLEQEQELKMKAESALLRAVELGNNEGNYHIACLYSLTGLLDKSMVYLMRAYQSGALPDREELFPDEWLEALRQTVAFQDFITDHLGESDD